MMHSFLADQDTWDWEFILILRIEKKLMPESFQVGELYF